VSINIVLPMAGRNMLLQDTKQPYPVGLIEIHNKPIIQWVMENLSSIDENKKFIFILNAEDCNKYHIDNSLKLITKDPHDIVALKGETKGAACSCLMAIDNIDLSSELLIVNSDQLFDIDLNLILKEIRNSKADSAIITFKSIHPRWSFARVEGDNVIETAEKNPISNDAIAGFYYFRAGSDFINAATRNIEKSLAEDKIYYISSTLNEMILMGKKVIAVEIPKEKYHTFYSPEKIKEFEKIKL